MSKLVVASANSQLDILLEIICVKLQLSKTQFETAEARYHTIGDWLGADGSAIAPFRPDIYPQGSLSLGTTVRPHLANEFDLDLVCELQLPSSVHPGDVYQSIWDRMAEHSTYAKMIKRCRRCVRVEYANDFHLDIVPGVPDSEEDGEHILVPDLHADLEPAHPKNNVWKPSNPRGYKKWFRNRCVHLVKNAYAKAEPLPQPEPIHKKPALKRAVQLFKRWRDIEFSDRMEIAPSSIILTTLGGHFHGGEALATDALDTIIDRVVTMRDRNEMICATNPANDKEVICEKWREDPGSLEAFDVSIREFQAAWKRLLAQHGLKEITDELKRLFGETAIDDAVKEFAERHINLPRQSGQLLMERTTGRVGTIAGLGGLSAGSAGLAIKETRFHGET